jgi:single-strand DNA-binding protein
MGSINRVTLVGNVVDSPEARFMQSGDPVAAFRVATNRAWIDDRGERHEAAEFHRIKCYRRVADVATKHVRVGRLVAIEGRLETRQWLDDEGKRRERTEVVAETVTFLDAASTRGEARPARPTAPAATPPSADDHDLGPMPDQN